MASVYAGRMHLVAGQDGSRRNRLLFARWYVEVTIHGFFLNVGWL